MRVKKAEWMRAVRSEIDFQIEQIWQATTDKDRSMAVGFALGILWGLRESGALASDDHWTLQMRISEAHYRSREVTG